MGITRLCIYVQDHLTNGYSESDDSLKIFQSALVYWIFLFLWSLLVFKNVGVSFFFGRFRIFERL